MVSIKSIIAISLPVACAHALTVSSISSCPALTPCTSSPADVTDLRIDDFHVIGALGDSIMAGFAMMDVGYNVGGTGALHLSLISEYRGNSYGIGMDTSAVTLANFVKNYRPNLLGGSVLSHVVSFCSGNECGLPETLCKHSFCLQGIIFVTNLHCCFYVDRPFRDNLNGAQSGALASYELGL